MAALAGGCWMPGRDVSPSVQMTRIAVVATPWSLRDVLIRVADSGVVEFDPPYAPGAAQRSEPAQRLQRIGASADPQLSVTEPDLDACERAGRADLLAGEAQLASRNADAVVRDGVAAWVGWAPSAAVPALALRLAEVGGAVAPLPKPRGVDPPTALRPGAVRQTFAPLVRTYATAPYADVDPSVLAGLAYVVMFGAMFGDTGHGALLVLAALLVRTEHLSRLARLRRYWGFIAAAGVASMVFGLLYGEFFGPTGVVPTVWLAPMERPVPLLIAGIALGAVLLAGAYALGTVNRVREAGWVRAVYAPSGIAGSAVFLAAGLAALGWYAHAGWLKVVAAVLATAGIGLALTGLLGGSDAHGGARVAQAAVELFDLVVRIGANVLSFARLAAFGLTHAVLGWIVWSATVGLWQRGPIWAPAAVVVFVIGNAVSFALEALVAAIQALRLEYYELFSRVFETEGRPYSPWRVPIDRAASADLASHVKSPDLLLKGDAS